MIFSYFLIQILSDALMTFSSMSSLPWFKSKWDQLREMVDKYECRESDCVRGRYAASFSANWDVVKLVCRIGGRLVWSASESESATCDLCTLSVQTFMSGTSSLENHSCCSQTPFTPLLLLCCWGFWSPNLVSWDVRIKVHGARRFCLRSALYSEVDQMICENPKNLCRDLQHPAALLLMFGKFNILLSQMPHMFVYCAWTLECADRAITKFMFQTGVAPWPFWSQRGAQNKDFWQRYYCKPHVEWLFW